MNDPSKMKTLVKNNLSIRGFSKFGQPFNRNILPSFKPISSPTNILIIVLIFVEYTTYEWNTQN